MNNILSLNHASSGRLRLGGFAAGAGRGFQCDGMGRHELMGSDGACGMSGGGSSVAGMCPPGLVKCGCSAHAAAAACSSAYVFARWNIWKGWVLPARARAREGGPCERAERRPRVWKSNGVVCNTERGVGGAEGIC